MNNKRPNLHYYNFPIPKYQATVEELERTADRIRGFLPKGNRISHSTISHYEKGEIVWEADFSCWLPVIQNELKLDWDSEKDQEYWVKWLYWLFYEVGKLPPYWRITFWEGSEDPERLYVFLQHEYFSSMNHIGSNHHEFKADSETKSRLIKRAKAMNPNLPEESFEEYGE